MSTQESRKKFIEKFRELASFYEKLHDEHEYKPHRVSSSIFYKNFLKRLNETLGEIESPKIAVIIGGLRSKAEYLSQFNEKRKLHDLAERMVDRLNEVELELYSVPDLEFFLETTKDIKINVLITCCPEFQCDLAEDGSRVLKCDGSIHSLKISRDQDLQSAVRYYHERYCSACKDRLPKIQEEIYRFSEK
ncbi:MAG: hypothetical protein ACTSVI_06310 [Promethearchaeota archaeon]